MNQEVSKRLAPSKDTWNLLFALSGNQCAFPGCQHPLWDEENKFIAQLCHIEAAMPGGERYNAAMTNEDRRKPENLVLLCYPHHIRTNNVDRYPVDVLRRIKHEHESLFRQAGRQMVASESLIEEAYYEELQKIETALYKIDRQTLAIKGDTEQIKGNTEMILDAVNRISNPDPVANDFMPEIESALKWRETHQYEKSISLLNELRKQHWEKFYDLEKYKVLANIGICYMDLGQNDVAAQYWVDAYPFQPEGIRAMNLAAMGYSILGNEAESRALISKSLVADPGNADAYVTQITLDTKKGDFAQVVANIPVAYRAVPIIAVNIANAAKNLKNIQEAINWAEIAVDAAEGKEKTNFKSVLARFILESIHNLFSVFDGKLNNDTITKANYVIKLYSAVLEEGKQLFPTTILSSWLINRGLAKRIIGKLDGSFEDSLTAVLTHKSVTTLEALATAAVRTNNFSKALECIQSMEEIASKDELVQITLFRAEVYYLQGRTDEIILLLEKFLIQNISDQQRLQASYMLIDVYKKIGNITKAVKINEQLLKDYPNIIPPYVFKAELLEKKSQIPAAIAALREGQCRIVDTTEVEYIHLLAKHFHRHNQYQEAIALYERITDLTQYNTITRELLKLYYDAGETKKVLDNCNRLILSNGVNLSLSEFLVVTYDFLDDVDNAIDVCKKYLSVNPDDQRMIIRLALLYDKINDRVSLKQLLSKIDKLDHQLDVRHQFKIAELLVEIDEVEKCHHFAYQTWQGYYHEKTAHEWFANVSIQCNRVDKLPKDPKIVSCDSAVTIVDDNEVKRSYLITPNGNNGILEEIAVSDNIAKHLIGRTLGNKVTIAYKNYTIKEILHPFNFASRTSFKLLSDKFIDSEVFRSFKVGNTGDIQRDLKSLFDLIDKDVAHADRLRAIYKESPITLGMIAESSNDNPIKTWNKFLHFESPGIDVIGAEVELNQAFQYLDQNRGIIIDAITLNSVASLDLLEDLSKLPNVKVVAQSTLNHFHEQIKEMSLSSSGIRSVGKVGGSYTRVEMSSEEVGTYLGFLRKLVKWVEGNCEILPCEPALNMLAHEKKEKDELFGKSFYETLLLAQHHNYLLYAEELRLRHIAKDLFQVDGIGSYGIMAYLNEKKLIGNQMVDKVLYRMIMFNYKLIPVNSEILLLVFETVKDITHPIFLSALNGLKSERTSYSHSISTGVIFFGKIYDSVVMKAKIEEDPNYFVKAVQSILRVIFEHVGPADKVYEIIVMRCKILYPAMDPWAEELLGTIEQFYKSRLELI